MLILYHRYNIKTYKMTKNVKKKKKRYVSIPLIHRDFFSNLYDVVHFHAEGPCNFLNMFGKIGSKKRKRMPKIIVTIHGLDWQRSKWNRFASSIIMRGERMAVKYADEIIVLSKNNQKYFYEKYNRKTTYIPNGVSPAHLHEPEIIKDKWNLDKNG